MLCVHELDCSAVARMQVNKTLSVEPHFFLECLCHNSYTVYKGVPTSTYHCYSVRLAEPWGTFVRYCFPQLIALCVLYTEIKNQHSLNQCCVLLQNKSCALVGTPHIFQKLVHLFTHGKLVGLHAKRSRLLVAELYWHLKVDCSSQITPKMYLLMHYLYFLFNLF